MKKYIKPEFFYERYELAQHIADCQWEITSQEMNTCQAYGEIGTGYEDMSLFVSGIACDIAIDKQAWEDYCYQNGADGVMKVFAS